MHYSGIVVALTALSSLTAALPRPFDSPQPRFKGIPIKSSSRSFTAKRSTESPGVITRRAIEGGATVLKPIKVHQSFAKRAVENDDDDDSIDFSRLDLSKQAELIYGAPDSDGTIFLANMTLHAPDGRPIIMMENFETLTSSIDCDGADGVMSLTFKSKKAMDYALQKWAYINEREEDDFILIANHEGCGPDEERIPYAITDVKNDGLKTYLTAREESWNKISGTFEIDFGKVALNKPSQKLARRLHQRGIGDVFDKVTDKVKDGFDTVKDGITDGVNKVVDKIKDIGDGSFDKAITLSLDTGEVGNGLALSDPTGTLTLDCRECNIRGGIKLTGRVAVEDFKPKELIFSASPQGLSTTLDLGVTLSAATSVSSPTDFSQNIASLPLGGIVIPQVFSLGPKLDFEMGASLDIVGDASFNFGITAALPDNMVLTANVLDITRSEATEGDGATSELIPFTVESITASLEITAFARPTLSLGVEILGGAFGVETSIKFDTPAITAALTAEFDQLGVCSQEAGASKTGVRVSTRAQVGGTFFVGTDQTVGEIALVNKPLFSKSFELKSVCIEIDIPGLDKVPEEVVEDGGEEVVDDGTTGGGEVVGDEIIGGDGTTDGEVVDENGGVIVDDGTAGGEEIIADDGTSGSETTPLN